MLDPEAAAVLAEIAATAEPMPADEAAWLAGYRAELDGIVAMQGPAPAAAVREVTPEGAPPLRLIAPEEGGGAPRPTVLFIHGGGFVAGSLAGYDVPLRHLARRSGWLVAAVDYRLAPEHPFPAAPDDCFAALRHLAGMPGVDPRRLAVMGDSAGGLLAAATAMRARDAGIALALQVLLYPNADLREGDHHPSRAAYDGAVVRIDELYRSLALYLRDAERAAASPLLAPTLAGLCSALVVTCEHDPLRDEGEAYALRLREAGVAVEAERLPGAIHSLLQRGSRIRAGDELISRLAARLKALA